MLQTLYDFFHIIVDLAFLLQLLSISVAMVIVFDRKIECWRDFFVAAIKVACAFSVMFFLQLAITMLAILVPFMRGIGSWISFFVGITFYAVAFNRQPLIKKMVSINALFITSFVVSLFGTVLGMAITQKIPDFDILFTKISADILIIFFAIVFNRHSIFNCEVDRNHFILNLFCGFITSVICIAYNLYEMHVFGQSREIFMPFVTILLACLYFINLGTYLMTYFLCKSNQEVMELQGERDKNKYLEELLAVSESNVEELRKVRHDVKNQYIYMRELLVGKKYDELDDYFTEMLGTFAKPLFSSIDSGNKSVDSVLNMEIDKANACDVKMDMKVAVPSVLPFEKTDICRLFANILDNAIEGCVRSQIKDAMIEVVSDVRGDYLRFCVINPTNEVKDLVGIGTSKRDKNYHGYGNKIICGIVKKYKGIYHHGIEGNKYIAEVMIDMRF